MYVHFDKQRSKTRCFRAAGNATWALAVLSQNTVFPASGGEKPRNGWKLKIHHLSAYGLAMDALGNWMRRQHGWTHGSRKRCSGQWTAQRVHLCKKSGSTHMARYGPQEALENPPPASLSQETEGSEHVQRRGRCQRACHLPKDV